MSSAWPPTESGSPADSYDEVPYTSFPDPARHPERLATIATLLGLDVAPVATCRVLEFACGDGASLIPVAASLPDATFVGFDAAAGPIARARGMARDLRVSNVSLLELDVRELPESLGRFDYIVVHGLYSWVPADVRACVMPLVARHLAPNGVACVSFNVLPGARMRGVIQDMLRDHTRGVAGLRRRIAAARALLDLVGTPAGDDDLGHQALRAEARSAAGGSDGSLAHDDLNEWNTPFHFHEFAADAERAGLAYLAESRPASTSVSGLAPNVREALDAVDRLAREQYFDFVRFRHYRESLLCHAGALSSFVVQPSRASRLHAVPSLDVRRAAARHALTEETDAAAAAIVRELLARWPMSVPVEMLSRLNAPAAPAQHASRPVETVVTRLFSEGMVDLRTAPAAVVAQSGPRPEAFAAARWLSREHEVIPNLYHEALRYADPLGRTLLALLDGTRTRDELAARLGAPFAGSAGCTRLDRALAILAGRALLVA